MVFGIRDDRYAEQRYRREEIGAKLRLVDGPASLGRSVTDAVRAKIAAWVTPRHSRTEMRGLPPYRAPSPMARLMAA